MITYRLNYKLQQQDGTIIQAQNDTVQQQQRCTAAELQRQFQVRQAMVSGQTNQVIYFQALEI